MLNGHLLNFMAEMSRRREKEVAVVFVVAMPIGQLVDVNSRNWVNIKEWLIAQSAVISPVLDHCSLAGWINGVVNSRDYIECLTDAGDVPLQRTVQGSRAKDVLIILTMHRHRIEAKHALAILWCAWD